MSDQDTERQEWATNNSLLAGGDLTPPLALLSSSSSLDEAVTTGPSILLDNFRAHQELLQRMASNL